VDPPKPQLKLTDFAGPLPQAYGLVVVRDFVAFLRYAADVEPGQPRGWQVQFAFVYGISQSGRFMRTFLLHGLNTIPAGKVFDGLLPNGARQATSTSSAQTRILARWHIQCRNRVCPVFLVGADGTFRN